jgi:hypothetical protein
MARTERFTVAGSSNGPPWQMTSTSGLTSRDPVDQADGGEALDACG